MGKGLALLAMLAPKKGAGVGDDGKMHEASDLESEGKMSAAEDILAAIKKGDAMALSDALEAHYECCRGMGMEGDDEDEGPKSSRY